jgi:hypothetical protein
MLPGTLGSAREVTGLLDISGFSPQLVNDSAVCEDKKARPE